MLRRSTQVGRRGAPAKGVGRVTGARVRISPSPPQVHRNSKLRWTFFCQYQRTVRAALTAVLAKTRILLEFCAKKD